jgi:YVTN family beta-propeller protein
VTATVPVGEFPFGVAANRKTNIIYATNEEDSSVSVISGRTSKVVATIRVGGLPLGVAANPDGNTAYVANATDNTVSVLAHCPR